MRPFDHPSPRLFAGVPLQFLGFFPSWSDMEREAEFLRKILNFLSNVGGIQAEVLLLPYPRFWAVNLDALDCRAGQLAVVPVGAVNGDAERNALLVGEHAALGTTLCPVDGTRPCFFFLPAVLS